MEVLFHNVAVGLVFLTMAAFAWLHGGSRADVLMPVIPWLWALMLEGLLFFPQRRPYEDVVSARKRCWRGLGRDPLLYFTFIFLLVLVIPFVNRGLCPACDYPQIMAGADPAPPVPFAPFCVNLREHYGVLLWFLPALTAMLAARHSLARQGKRILLEMIVWNGAILAVLGFIQQGTGAEAPFWGPSLKCEFFSVFGYPNMGGSFFTMLFAFSVGLWQHRLHEVAELPKLDKTNALRENILKRWLHAHYALVPAALNFFGAIATLCRAAIMLTFILVGMAFLYHLLQLVFSRHDRVRRIKQAAYSLAGLLVFLVIAYVFAPANLGKEVDSVSSLGVLDRVSGKGQYHTRVATAIFKSHPLFGVGGWGYKHFCLQKDGDGVPYMTNEELRQLQKAGGANVHNDYVQFLAEHGAVGVTMLLFIVIGLLYSLFHAWVRLYKAARFVRPNQAPPKPTVLYCFPAGTFWVILGNVALLIHAFGDCPMRSAAVLSTFFVSLACAEGFLPRELEDRR